MPVKKCNKIQCFVCYSLFQYSRDYYHGIIHGNVNFQQLFVVVKTTESEEWTSLCCLFTL